MSNDTPAPQDPDEAQPVASSEGEVPALPDLGALLGGDGGLDLGNLLETAQAMQQNLRDAQAKAAEAVVEGVAGGGAVRVQATAGLEFQAVHLSLDAVREALEDEDTSLLEDLVLAALRDVVTQANEHHAAALGGLGPLGDLLG